jgi:phage-related protein
LAGEALPSTTCGHFLKRHGGKRDGTIEVRIHVGTEHRVFVVSKFEEAIYVLHAFDKTSQQTSRHDLELAKQRYRDLIAERRQR